MAQVELSFYGGLQSVEPSDVVISGDSVLPDETHSMIWEGSSFDPQSYYGVRATIWDRTKFGYGIDFTHARANSTELPSGYSRLAFAEGLNTLTVNAYRRWDEAFAGLSPYVGGGLGMAIPNLEVGYGGSETSGLQVTGPAATFLAGASYPVTDEWSLFGEYKSTFSSNIGDLNGGGTASSDVVTNALNLGVSFNF